MARGSGDRPHHVIDALTPEQLGQLTTITDAVLQRLDPTGTVTAMYHRHDEPASHPRKDTPLPVHRLPPLAPSTEAQ